MGRPLGAYDSDELDRPDLNKCPDCGCFFASECCPLCGKPCPPEMQAGNRAPVKIKKRRQSGSGRVTFVEWYHSWWFIILMLLVFPIAGIVLLVTSPHKRGIKVAVAAGGVAVWFVSTFGLQILFGLFTLWAPPPVDTTLSREEYIAACEEMTPEGFYRSADSLQGKFVQLTVTVEAVLPQDYSESNYNVYYLCSDPQGGNFRLLIRDCVQDAPQNLLPGDRVTVWGEGAGSESVYGTEDYVTAPCLNVAYLRLEK